MCKKIATKYHLKHVSIGDWLRAEVEKQNDTGILVQIYLAHGDLIPDQQIKNIVTEVVTSLRTSLSAMLIDGFPRKSSQIPSFDEVEPAMVLFFNCPREIARDRVLSRNDPTRSLDTPEVFDKRYAEFERENPAILEHFAKAGKEVVVVDTSGATDKSWTQLMEHLDKSTAWKKILEGLESDFETVASYESPTETAET